MPTLQRKIQGALGLFVPPPSSLSGGQGNFHLGEAYAACGILGRSKIGVPGGTRMVVYSSDFLAQSFAHFAARYRAVWAHYDFVKALSEDPNNNKSSRKRSEKRSLKLRRVGEKLADAQRQHVLASMQDKPGAAGFGAEENPTDNHSEAAEELLPLPALPHFR